MGTQGSVPERCLPVTRDGSKVSPPVRLLNLFAIYCETWISRYMYILGRDLEVIGESLPAAN
jgi:hypothetical protein